MTEAFATSGQMQSHIPRSPNRFGLSVVLGRFISWYHGNLIGVIKDTVLKDWASLDGLLLPDLVALLWFAKPVLSSSRKLQKQEHQKYS